MSIFHVHEKNQKENQAVVINTWSSKELMHGIASFFFFILFVLPYVFQIFIVNHFFQVKNNIYYVVPRL